LPHGVIERVIAPCPVGRSTWNLADDMTMADVPGGTGTIRSLVIRTWNEVEPTAFRARGVEVVAGRRERQVFVSSSVDEACEAIRVWLENGQLRGTNGRCDGAVTPMEFE
jgi:hypothetical protein